MKTINLPITAVTTAALVIVSSLSACSKSDDTAVAPATTSGVAGTGSTAAAVEQADDVAAIYTAITAQVGALNITSYASSASLALTDDTGTTADWSTTTRFNCFGECENGSITTHDFVDDAMNPDKPGPVGDVKRKLDVFCFVGQLFEAGDIEGGLPIVAASHPVTIDDAVVTRLVDNCGMKQADAAEMKDAAATVTVTDPASAVFDRYVDFVVGEGDDAEHNPFYIKNSGGIISVAMFEAKTNGNNNEHGISRTMFKLDLATEIFQFEYFGRIVATGTSIQSGGSRSMSRGYHNGVTGELAYLSDMGNDYYQVNHSFLALSGNDNEAQLGAYLSRTADNESALTGAFYCVDKSDGSFINGTGCTENAGKDRKHAWSVLSPLFVTVGASANADWELGPTTEVADFDADTIFTLAPTFK